jgi:hypothetical protein
MPFPLNHHQGWAAVACACACLASAPASAQILDRIEVSRVNGVAEIRISFAVQVQYQRHTPPGKGRELDIFVKPISAAPPESEIIEETMASPETDLVPSFRVMYPHLGNAISIRFAQETEWKVRPTPDGRSIVIVVPVLKGARDFVSEVHAQPQPPKAQPAPVPAPTTTVAPPVAAAEPAPSTGATVTPRRRPLSRSLRRPRRNRSRPSRRRRS